MIFFMAGTSDARALALSVQAQGYPVTASVVTENACRILREAGISARCGRLDAKTMTETLRNLKATVLVDASHPFAEEAHRTAMAAADACGIPYIRYERPSQNVEDNRRLHYVSSYKEAASAALQRKGNILLTTGSKTLQIFTTLLLNQPDIRLIVRILPRQDNLEKCAQLGVEQKNIIAMQGPFSRRLNEALYRQYGVTLMITKESGEPGNVDEKVAAAIGMGIDVIVIGRPKIAYGQCVFTETELLARLCLIHPLPMPRNGQRPQKSQGSDGMDSNSGFQPLTTQPQAIESKSFQIIQEELGAHPFTDEQFKVVQRVIHASADFELGRSLVFHPEAVQSGVAAVRRGESLVADVQMVHAGINKGRLAECGGDIHVYIADPDVVSEAKALGTTRSILAMRKAVKEHPRGIFVIGNAPTALLELIRLVKEGQARPSLIVGLPVGFVSAAESKRELTKIQVPFITNQGRKGGSSVAVAAVNAILLLAGAVSG